MIFFSPNLLKLVDKAMNSLLVQFFCLLLLLSKLIRKTSLLFILKLQQIDLCLLLGLVAILSPYYFLKLTDLNSLHVDGVLKLQSLLLQEKI